MDPRRLRHYADQPGRSNPHARQSIDGFLPSSRSLPPVHITRPVRPAAQLKPRQPAPVLPEPVRPVVQAEPRPLPQPTARQVAQPPVRQPVLPQRNWEAAKQPARRRTFRWRYAVVPLVCVGLVAAGLFIWQRHGSASGDVASLQTQTPASKQAEKVAAPATLPTADGLAAYKASIQSIFDNNPQVRATVITVNLKTGQKVQLGSTEPYTAASTAKLLTAVTYFLQVEKGSSTLSQIMSNGQTAQYTLQQMIVLSDNDCWAVLNKYLTHAKLSAEATAIGMTAYDPTNNVLAADDTAKLLQQLYDGTLINSDNREMLLGWMEKANYRDNIVAAVPSEYTVYHKVGVIDDFLHDAAIITKGDEALELVIYTDGGGSYDTDARETMMHDITKAALAAYFKPDSSN